MAEFLENFHELKPLMDIVDPSLEIMSHFAEVNESTIMENSNFVLMGSSNGTHLPQQPKFTSSVYNSLPDLLPLECSKPAAGEEKKKIKLSISNSSFSPSKVAFREDNTKKKNSSRSAGGKKRGRSSSKDIGEKPMEVVHVRARRGQATDSHSLAERVRREKINERMRCLQGLVPGCYKSMGMAVMLDEIISYVQSLQKQVEFLSMKLSAASSFYDFNLDMETIAAQVLPWADGANEAQVLERLAGEGYGDCSGF